MLRAVQRRRTAARAKVAPLQPSESRERAGRIGTLLFRCRRRVFEQVRRTLDEAGESVWDYRLLACLHEEGPAIQAQLADATAQHPASVSRLVDDLERQGLVRRARDAQDRRRIQVELTAAGEAKLRELRALVLPVVEVCFSGLGREEQELLEAVLSKLVAGQA
jgi:MarR family transcriptional regulator, 2-MHQ and catechol-resistance regulon repressor